MLSIKLVKEGRFLKILRDLVLIPLCPACLHWYAKHPFLTLINGESILLSIIILLAFFSSILHVLIRLNEVSEERNRERGTYGNKDQ